MSQDKDERAYKVINILCANTEQVSFAFLFLSNLFSNLTYFKRDWYKNLPKQKVKNKTKN